MAELSERKGVPESSSRKRAPSKALRVRTPQAARSPMWCGSSAISKVGPAPGRGGDRQGGPAASAQPVRLRPGRDRLVGDGDAVEVGRLRPVRVWPVRLEVDAVAASVGGPLAAGVGGGARPHAA